MAYIHVNNTVYARQTHAHTPAHTQINKSTCLSPCYSSSLLSFIYREYVMLLVVLWYLDSDLRIAGYGLGGVWLPPGNRYRQALHIVLICGSQ